MKHILITTIAAVLLVGCGTTKQATPPAEAKSVAEEPQPEASAAKLPEISINDAIDEGNIEAVKQHLAAGADVNAKDSVRWTPLHHAAFEGYKEIAELLIAKGADVNAKDDRLRKTPLDQAIRHKHPEIADLLRKHGGKTGEELK